MRKFILASITTLALAGCSASASAMQHLVTQPQSVVTVAASKSVNMTDLLLNGKKPLTLLEKEAQKKKRMALNTKRVDAVLKRLKTYAGKTWYVFSGSTPRGWDCSGLVRWTYEQLGIELEHRASLQADAGRRVSKPVPGDIVAYFYPGSTRSYHTAIYLGKGKMINAPRPGTLTAIEPVNNRRLKGSQIRYIRVIEQSRGN